MTRKGFARSILAAVVIVFYGCAPALIPMDKEELIQLKNLPEVDAVHYESPAFLSDVGVYGVVGFTLMAAKGKSIKETYKIEDPTLAVKARFVDNLISELKLIHVRLIDQPFRSDSLDDIRQAHTGRLLFDFKTIGWGTGIRSGFSTDQYIGYSVRGRLIRTEDSKVLWQGLCKFETPDIKRAALTENDGALLKGKLREAGDTCAADLWVQFQGKNPRTN